MGTRWIRSGLVVAALAAAFLARPTPAAASDQAGTSQSEAAQQAVTSSTDTTSSSSAAASTTTQGAPQSASRQPTSQTSGTSQTSTTSSTRQPAARQAKSATPAAKATVVAASGYANVTAGNAALLQSATDTTPGVASSLGTRTYQIKSLLTQPGGAMYYGLQDHTGRFVGYVPTSAVAKTTAPAGQPETVSRFITISKKGWSIWRDFNWTSQASSTSYYGQTFQITKIYHHYNGTDFYLLTKNGRTLGYLNVAAAKTVTKPQGTQQTLKRYVKLTRANYTLWQDLLFKGTKGNSSTLLNRTVYAKYAYHHVNGSTYYSLYDFNDNWLGYVNQAAASLVAKPGGNAQRNTGYFRITKAGWTLWRDLNFQKIASSTTKYVGQTFKATYVYHHVNGASYYSLYTNAGKWLGYYNATGGTRIDPAQGLALKQGSYARITARNMTLWRNFSWQKLHSSGTYYGQNVYLRYVYHHANGSSYYSVYDAANKKWLGYLNSGGVKLISPQGSAITEGYQVTITSRNYAFYNSFNWSHRADSATYYGQSLTAKCAYYHVNGQFYYSLYRGDQWIGYINTNATSVKAIRYRKLAVPNYNQYALGIPEGCEGVSLLQALKAKGYATAYSPHQFLSLIPKASSPYNGFVGSPFKASNQYTAIFASPLAKWGNKFGNVTNLSGSSVTTLLKEVAKGNPVVVYVTVHFASPTWAKWPFGTLPNNNHAVTLAGFNQATQQVYVSDPIDGQYWLSLSKFTKIYNARKMAVVVR